MVYVELCGQTIKCFTDFPPHLIYSPSHGLPVTTEGIEDLMLDNGVYTFLASLRLPPIDRIFDFYVKFVLKSIDMFNKPKIVRLIVPDYPYDTYINLKWAWEFGYRYRFIETVIRLVGVEDVVVYVVCHHFDKFIDKYIELVRQFGWNIAFPLRRITFSKGIKSSVSIRRTELEHIFTALQKAYEAVDYIHLLGPSRYIIKQLPCHFDLKKITFDSLSYRRLAPKVPPRDVKERERWFWIWWRYGKMKAN